MHSNFLIEILVEEMFSETETYFKGNIEMDLKKIEYVGINWVDLGQGRLQ
jgi:hypothetical protein